ncbi:inositol hexakisphosphate-domain-containing protein [Lactarius psammicola]|nr:inositol hexakisphosphate-domain-containing protein [Lactarius psammicola]
MEKADIRHEDTWGASVSPKFASNLHSLSLTPRPSRNSDSPVPIIQRPQSSPPRSNTESDGSPASPPDLISHMQKSAPSIVKTRTGSVLSRGFILKTDFYPSGRALDLDLNVHGAPNFRAPRTGSLNVFGAAQPRSQGLRAILSVLRARPTESSPSHVIWFSTREEPIVYISGRPFVLRDSAEPRKTLPLSDRPENLEAIEQRLKNDILAEAVRFGLIKIILALEDGDGAILPTWTAVDSNNVRTSRELWEYMRKEGWHVEVRTHIIPISPDRPIEDNYVDAYLQVIRNADPVRTSLVFSCGMGAVRTTFAMTAACLVRRRQLMLRGLPDPYAARLLSTPNQPNQGSGINTPNGYATPPQSILGEAKILQALEQANAQQDLNRSLLRLTHILQQILPSGPSRQVIDLLLTNSSLLNDLRKAHMGNYGIILSLLGCLDDGLKAKKLVDKVVDTCDHVVNLREDILVHRIKYSLSSLEESTSNVLRAAKALEKYFFTIAFASFVEAQHDFSQSFSDWLKVFLFLRKSYGTRLSIFSPVNDLSSLSKSGLQRSLVRGQTNDVAISGGQILGDEYSDHVVKNRSGIILREGTLLKSDQWLSESQHVSVQMRGAINFRNIPGTNIYALGQPTVEAIDGVIDHIKRAHPEAERIAWVMLREEPIVYVNGAPYCLRRERSSLRNMKDYGGISAERLEILEERLRDDVVSELHSFGGKLLLHTETTDGSVIPVWEEVRPGNVAVMKDVMTACKGSNISVDVFYRRVPITAERQPDFSDFSELIAVMLGPHMAHTPIVVNDQLGRGRSTLTSIILILLEQWLARPLPPSVSRRPSISHPHSMLSSVLSHDGLSGDPPLRRQSFQVINNLLRVIRKGPVVKGAVDDAIDQCAEVFNLRDSIEEARIRAEHATDEREKRSFAQRGLQNLRRYFELIVFQAYLQSTEPDTLQTYQTFEAFVKSLPVIKTFEKELLAEGIDALKPLKRVDLADGIALPDEVTNVVTNRSGSILSASTILKSDFFTNLQKMTLPERIDGAPNFRRVPLALQLISEKGTPPPSSIYFAPSSGSNGKNVCGSSLTSCPRLRRALSRVNAGPDGNNRVVWTSLREEPVIYVAGRPHVLRLAMEENFKRDVIREVRAGNGRILLHDEVEERPNVFAIVPLWENVSEEDIMTPGDVFKLMAKEGYKIDYGRIAITDEQAPLPGALSQLLEIVTSTYDSTGDFIFNCQMGRGRTTTGMITACLIASSMNLERDECVPDVGLEGIVETYDAIDGPSEEEAYLQGTLLPSWRCVSILTDLSGEYKTILQLVGVLSHGKTAKRLTDGAIDLMQDVQNLRKAVYDNKLKLGACEKGTTKYNKLFNLAVNYLYRYGVLIVFANYLIERRFGEASQDTFPEWLSEHREITKLLSRRSLD